MKKTLEQDALVASSVALNKFLQWLNAVSSSQNDTTAQFMARTNLLQEAKTCSQEAIKKIQEIIK